MVKILGIDGSPRPYGNTRKALLLALEGAKREGADVEVLELYKLRVEPCLGCVSDDIKACRYPCPIDDDMKHVYEKVLKSDGIIVATPIYWYNVSGPVKNFIDRLTVFENMIFIDGRSWVEGKVAGFIAVGNDTGAIAVIQNLMSVFNSMGFAIPPWSLAYYTLQGDILEDEKAVLDSVNVGRAVALLAEVLKGCARPPKVWYRADKEYRSFSRLVARKIKEQVEKFLG
ncbi:MAG: flavodoxin family protein [Thermoprotei archaeon]|nr:MAG: flavodoxin family protein [Thermoprotei archaeon]